MNELKSCCIGSHNGVEMHTDTITKWVYKNGLDESQVKPGVKYKVWLQVNEKSDPKQSQPYTCEVYCFEEVPQQILEAEELAKRYWAAKEPKKIN